MKVQIRVNTTCILLVENEPLWQERVRDCLEPHGFVVCIAPTGADVSKVLEQQLPALAIVELYLPDQSGFNICEAIKKVADIPIIMLTVDTSRDTKLVALDRYAEDVMTKPFDPEELLLRIKRRLRWSTAYPTPVVVDIDDHLRIHLDQHIIEVRDDSGTVQQELLNPLEARLLEILVRQRGRILLTDAIIAQLWPFVDMHDHTPHLRVHINSLRKKIEPDPTHPRHILTKMNIGYSFAGKEDGDHA